MEFVLFVFAFFYDCESLNVISKVFLKQNQFLVGVDLFIFLLYVDYKSLNVS